MTVGVNFCYGAEGFSINFLSLFIFLYITPVLPVNVFSYYFTLKGAFYIKYFVLPYSTDDSF